MDRIDPKAILKTMTLIGRQMNLTPEEKRRLALIKIDNTEDFSWVKGRHGITIISNFGRVFSLAKNGSPKELSQYIFRGYKHVSFCTGPKIHPHKIHRLVALHFVQGYQEGLTVNHKDMNKLNNHHSNLEWVTNAENVKHGWRNGAFVNCGPKKPVVGTDCETGKKIYLKSMTDGEKFGFRRRGISQCVNGASPKYKGYSWELNSRALLAQGDVP